MIKLLHGDCLERMKTLEDNSVDAIVTDPPYGISFMAKKWDYNVPSVEVWQEAMRVLKPGGHALIACGTRTQHRMVCNIEDAGFEIRDVVSWIYGSGFPKSLNISKAIDKAAGAEREVVGKSKGAASQNTESLGKFAPEYDATAPATDAAKQWDGWGTALKPACEFFTLARKPLSEKTVAANVLKWGTGGINVDGCRVGTDKTGRFPANLIHDGSQEVLDLFPETKTGKVTKSSLKGMRGTGVNTSYNDPRGGGSASRFFKSCTFDSLELTFERAKALLGLWKIKNANTVDASSHQLRELDYTALSHAVIAAGLGGKRLSEWKEPSTPATQTELKSLCESLITAMLSLSEESWPDRQQGVLIPNGCLVSVAEAKEPTDITTITISLPKSDGYAEPVTFSIMQANTEHGGRDSSHRAFYCAKASKRDRNEGLEGFEEASHMRVNGPRENEEAKTATLHKNNHPTVKPTALMQYLCRLITPPGGTVLDPFMGSGSTGKAAIKEGFDFIGCELDEGYYNIAQARIGGTSNT